MDNMIKQMRVKFSGLEETHDGETSHVKDRKLSSLKTRSFKEEGSRRVQNRYRGQSSRELTYDYDSDYLESDEFRTAVAAAAFAVGLVEDRASERQRRNGGSSSKPKRKQDQDGAVSVSRRIKERIPSSSPFASNKMKNKEDDETVPISTPSLLSKKFSELQERLPQRANSLANTELKPGSGGLGSSIGDRKPVNQPTVLTNDVNRKRPQTRQEDIKAEVWEKTELERIKERYEKLNAKILEWENEKKAKAKKKLSSNQDNQSEKKRARALQSYKNKTEMIDQIAEGARAQAEENRRKDVVKVKKKADTIRVTGKIPTRTCLCC